MALYIGQCLHWSAVVLANIMLGCWQKLEDGYTFHALLLHFPESCVG